MRSLWIIVILPFVFQSQENQKPPADDIALVKRLHARAVESSGNSSFVDYRNTYVDGIEEPVTYDYEMVAIRGGTFSMGSSSNEDESPVHAVKVSPFWMGKYEVPWDLFQPFSITAIPRNPDGSPKKIPLGEGDDYVVSKPTVPYVSMDFGMGLEGYPAVNMTQHAASKFCQWLSAKTGHFYRLPTEAEWEYACRAGTTGPFSCPEEKIHEYAVFEPDPENPKLDGYARIGTKKPNPWGLFDMHGNVMEWCLDQYNSLTYDLRSDRRHAIVDPLVMPNRVYPRVARGGSWYDPSEDCRSARRFYSEPSWKCQDPELPKSFWYHTDAHWLGFRIVRPLQVPSVEEMDFSWNSAHPDRVVKNKSDYR